MKPKGMAEWKITKNGRVWRRYTHSPQTKIGGMARDLSGTIDSQYSSGPEGRE